MKFEDKRGYSEINRAQPFSYRTLRDHSICIAGASVAGASGRSAIQRWRSEKWIARGWYLDRGGRGLCERAPACTTGRESI